MSFFDVSSGSRSSIGARGLFPLLRPGGGEGPGLVFECAWVPIENVEEPHMKPIDRRNFLKNSLLGAAAVSLPGHQPLAAQTAAGKAPFVSASQAPGIIDTNVNLFSWPFRA